MYQRIADNPKAILVGTQMVAKGHHFPNVTLVAIPNADRGFYPQIFARPEHTAQLIIQVAGRAGRADKAGLVLITNPATWKSRVTDFGTWRIYLSFAQQLLVERRMLGFAIDLRLFGAGGKQIVENNQQILHQAIALLPSRQHMTALVLRLMAGGCADGKKNSRYHCIY